MAMMRLDKCLSDTGTASRREARGLLRAGRVTVDGVVCRSGEVKLDPEHSRVTVDGRPVSFAKNHYFLLNKPLGVITATEDRNQQTVLDLLPAELRRYAGIGQEVTFIGQGSRAEIWDTETYRRIEEETLTPENLKAVMEELNF